eukprot:CAMPEP_0178408432 /NCGR_PEP_ID=MMETSP0689_2-20121128/19939_1 /TAXON_ID=160604 /ORGANISM="Amphidinium massartii, Strain CS-259" /LENGTH=435 /DNA_ID=CAMNT_0020029533 /DNA_START=33 /DNA_END=1340 /DNA_ORIENTATION=-
MADFEDQGSIEGLSSGDLVLSSGKDDSKSSYRRLRLLGQGSFGKAFLARDLATNELCVMKQMRVEKMDVKARDTAVREAVALRRVRHPNVVKFRQVFVKAGWLCLVMDFADGGDLCAAVKERSRSLVHFEESAVLECFGQVADAVHYVHSLKMVHRDIKSRNIFLCRTGRALLGDFGLVRLLETTCELAVTRVGTPYYLSPEIVRKQPYNYKTDIWSLGVLLYEMAGLQRPFVGTLETLPKAILKGTYPALPDMYSEGLKDLVAGMLQVDPEQRLDLGVALRGDVLLPPLERAREALGLEAPAPIEKSKKGSKLVDGLRRDVQDGAQHMLSDTIMVPKQDFIGFNTMVRKADAPLAPKGVEDVGFNTMVRARPPPATNAPAAHERSAAEDWSVQPQRDVNSDDDDLESMSDDSWGSVVKTGVDNLAEDVAKVQIS